jgi:hypothetical protein
MSKVIAKFLGEELIMLENNERYTLGDWVDFHQPTMKERFA